MTKIFNFDPQRLVISRSSKLYILWKFLEVQLSIVSSLIYAYFAAYRVDVEHNDYNSEYFKYRTHFTEP